MPDAGRRIRVRDRCITRSFGLTGTVMKGPSMNQIIYIVGAIVIIVAILGFVGLR